MTLRLSDAIRSLKASHLDNNDPVTPEASSSPSFEIVSSSYDQTAQSTRRLVKLNDIVVADRLRQYLNTEKTESLARSIQQYGFRGVLWVRLIEGRYHLVAGGRRYAACQMLEITEVPVEIWEVTDVEALQLELLENFQREDLNPIEEAEGVMRMLEITLELERSEVISLLNRKARQLRNHSTDNVVRSKKRSQTNGNGGSLTLSSFEEKQYQQIEEIFNLVGKYTPESFRTHRLPLLNLPKQIIEAVCSGQLEYTKARLIARIKDENMQKKVLSEAIDSGLSYAELTRRVKELRAKSETGSLSTNQEQFQYRANAIMRQLKSAKLEGAARKKIEKLITQIEELLAQTNS